MDAARSAAYDRATSSHAPEEPARLTGPCLQSRGTKPASPSQQMRGGAGPTLRVGRAFDAHFASTRYSIPTLYDSPGRNTAGGKRGSFGAFGNPCGSRITPLPSVGMAARQELAVVELQSGPAQHRQFDVLVRRGELAGAIGVCRKHPAMVVAAGERELRVRLDGRRLQRTARPKVERGAVDRSQLTGGDEARAPPVDSGWRECAGADRWLAGADRPAG